MYKYMQYQHISSTFIINFFPNIKVGYAIVTI